MITFRKMTSAEFLEFKENFITAYAMDLLKGEGKTIEEASKEAEEAINGRLAKWPDTADHVMMIEDSENGNTVGYIWYFYDVSTNEQQVILLDFLIYEDYRRKGYGSSALSELERKAKENGCKASMLFVWDHNGPGRALYRKFGYTSIAHDTGGFYMKKSLW